MRSLIGEIEQVVVNKGLLKSSQFVVVAVSGGLDSMVLLHALCRLADKYEWLPVVAHFNHLLRGEESDRDEEFVRQASQKLGLKCVTERADVGKLARKNKISIEMAARQLRHGFLARVCNSLAIETVALAHHANDQAELFFVRLFRGSSGEGLSGMDWISPSPASSSIRLIRPLLGIPKEDILAFARSEKIKFREDSSNAHSDYFRNRIRNELIPILAKKYQPALFQTILRTMEVVGEESDFARKAAEEFLGGATTVKFSQLHLAVQRRVLQAGLLKNGIVPDFDLIERLRQKPSNGIMIEPNRTVFADENGRIQLSNVAQEAFSPESYPLSIEGKRGETLFDGVKIAWQKESPKAGLKVAGKTNPNREVFDAELVGKEVVLRHWQPGDRFQPCGMAKSVKLQDLFTNRKIPRDQRRRLAVAVTKNGDIFWVQGLRISEQFKTSKSTKNVLVWEWH